VASLPAILCHYLLICQTIAKLAFATVPMPDFTPAYLLRIAYFLVFPLFHRP
jgi:hypothetical protein